MNANGAHKRRLTATAGLEQVDPAWSPDGKRIAYGELGPTPAQGIWVLRADGQGSPVQVTSGTDQEPTWSPNGRTIAFERADATRQTISILSVPAGGGTPVTLSTDPGLSDIEPAWSPDGRRILFASNRPDGPQFDLGDECGRQQRATRDEHNEPGRARPGPVTRRAADRVQRLGLLPGPTDLRERHERL